MRKAVLFVTVSLVGLMIASCKKTTPCTGKFAELPAALQGADTIQCSCAPNATGGSVWGSGVYTTDSSVCGAAAHVGAITPATGGLVTMKKSAGCAIYSGSTQNGVTSSPWGSYNASFYFVGKGDGSCPKIGEGGICPARFADLPAGTNEVSCTCGASPTGSVWGTDTYTTDSSLCAAAVHAGLITAAGGAIKAKKAPGCQSYPEAARNGVSTSSWGPFASSFYFPAKSDGTCSMSTECPSTFKDIPNGASIAELSCSCPAGRHGSVWGTDIYTRDSNLCVAALNAGAIGATGGKVTIKPAGGCPSYKASNRNGAPTSSWGKYDGSFYFSGHGDGKCR